MKAQLAEIVRGHPPAGGRSLVREYLQAQILSSLQRSGAMIPIAFHGGTALRFLFGIHRYSEDLDFALERANSSYDFRGFLAAIQHDLEAQAYQVHLKIDDQKVVNKAFVRFPGLLFELGLSGHQSEVIAVKLEVDTNPPPGAGLATTIVRRHALLNLQHHDKASLLAGKLLAVLLRAYTKGRDIYDLIWYLSDPDWPAPNLVMMNNGLRQAGWGGESVTEGNWRGLVRERMEQIDWEAARRDVLPFLERREEVDFVTKENVISLLRM